MNRIWKILCGVAGAFAFCFLTIGYAAVQDSLYVNGFVSVAGCEDKIISYSDTNAYTIDEYGTMTFNEVYYDPDDVSYYRIIGIEANGFSNQKEIEAVVIPDYVKTIGENAFNGCPDLVAYQVVTENEKYMSVDGILYSKDKTNLIHYPQNKQGDIFEIPENVTKIEAAAFDTNAHLNAIITNDVVDYFNEANWGAASRTIVIDNNLGENMDILSVSSSHLVTLSADTLNGQEITQTGLGGTAHDTVSENNTFTLSSSAYGSGKWLVLEPSTGYAFAVLDSNGTLHMYANMAAGTLPEVGDSLSNGATVEKRFKMPTHIPGALHWDDSVEFSDWSEARVATAVVVETPIVASTTNYWFNEFQQCTSFNLEKLDTSQVTSMAGMFTACINLVELDLSSFSNEHLINVSEMFTNCTALTTVYVGAEWTPKDDYASMSLFSNCQKLQGGRGTLYSYVKNNTAEYARADNDEFKSGYFTYKDDKLLIRNLLSNVTIDVQDMEDGNIKLVFRGESIPELIRIASTKVGVAEQFIFVENDETSSYVVISATKDQILSVADATNKTVFGVWDENGVLRIYNRIVYTEDDYICDEEGNKYLSSNVCSMPSTISVEGSTHISNDAWTVSTVKANIKSIVFVDEIKVDTAANMFQNLSYCTNITVCDDDGKVLLDTSSVTNMSSMFSGCTALTDDAVQTLFANISTENVTNMYAMFNGCKGLKNLTLPEQFNTSSVTNMSAMFKACSALTSLNLSSFDTSNVTTMSDMFNSCGNGIAELDLTSFNTSKVTTMQRMFESSKITVINLAGSNFSSDKLTSMRNMFARGTATTIKFSSSFTAEKVNDMTSAFLFCNKLTTLDLSYFKPQSLTQMQNTFNGTALTELDLSGFNTSKVSTMQAIFSDCKSLKTIYVGDGWILSTTITSTDMFKNCTALVGGNGTTYSSSNVTAAYAVIDGANGAHGYLTAKEGTAVTYADVTVDISALGESYEYSFTNTNQKYFFLDEENSITLTQADGSLFSGYITLTYGELTEDIVVGEDGVMVISAEFVKNNAVIVVTSTADTQTPEAIDGEESDLPADDTTGSGEIDPPADDTTGSPETTPSEDDVTETEADSEQESTDSEETTVPTDDTEPAILPSEDDDELVDSEQLQDTEADTQDQE